MVAALLLAVWLLLAQVWPVGPDYFFHYRRAAEDFFSGRTRLYDDGITTSFPLLPWAVFPLGVTLLFPLEYGQALLTVFTLISIGWLTLEVGRISQRPIPLWIVIASVCTLHTFDLVLRGNFEGFLCFGVALAWWGYKRERPLIVGLGVALFVMKPINMVLPGVFFAVAALRKGWRYSLWVAVPMVICLVSSQFIFGADWIGRYFATSFSSDEVYGTLSMSNAALYLQPSLWRFFEEGLGLSAQIGVWVGLAGLAATTLFLLASRGVTAEKLAFTLLAGLFFAVYLHGNHYVLVAPALAILLQRSRWYGWLWVLTLTPLLRAVWGFHNVWVDHFYMLGLLIGMGWVMIEQQHALNN